MAVPYKQRPAPKPRSFRLAAALAAVTVFAACADSPIEPSPAVELTPSFDVVSQVFTSGSHVTTWNAIPEPIQRSDWGTAYCTNTPKFGLGADWQNPHNAFVVSHGWSDDFFTAPWINAWSHNQSSGGNPVFPNHNWTKYSTSVTGNGAFVIRLLADNCSWIYLDGTLVGVQGLNLAANSYGLTLNGTHTLEFIIFDGGGAAGGQFRLETTTNPPPPLNPDLDGDGHDNPVDEFPLDPTEWEDTDGDDVGDNGDAFPNDPTRWEPIPDSDVDGVNDDADNCSALANPDQADLDGDNIGDACDPDIDGDGAPNDGDAFPLDPSESSDSDNDGVGNNADAFPSDPSETADSDSDGVGNNGDNCSTLANADQADLDGDGTGDACDPDVDDDGVANGSDVYPRDPAESADSDGDGIGNNADPYDNSNTGASLMVGTCNTGVANQHMGGGTWFNDLIAAAYASAGNHGKFVKAVEGIADGWKKAGLITGRDHGAIVSCAARTK